MASATPLNEAGWWHSVSSIEEFLARAQLNNDSEKSLIRAVRNKRPDEALVDVVFALAKFDMRCLDVDFTAGDKDLVLDFWLQIVQKDARPAAEEVAAFRQRLDASRHTARLKQEDENDANAFAIRKRKDAFDANERASPNGAYPSAAVLHTLLRQFDQYLDDQLGYMGPYTTVIGPSGIGKSFMMKQLAVRHGLSVSYANLAPSTAACYPRPVVLGRIPLAGAGLARTALESQWEAYLKQQLLFVRASREAGITAPGLFALMTSPTPDLVNARLVLNGAMDKGPDKHRDALAHCRHVLETHNENVVPLTPVAREKNAPIVLCLDEARALLHDESDNLSFRALRRVAKDVFEADQDTLPFFLVLLDTTSRISQFAPPIEFDPSRKLSQRRIFPPIYQIDTWDLFAPKERHGVDGTDSAVRSLFSYGRPLWGANMGAGDSPSGLVRLAEAKMAGATDPARPLALLSYRVNFRVTSRQLAETLVASWMRYVVSFSNENKMPTTQPSEPVLAYASSRALQDPQVRLSCIKTWFGSLQEGTCNLGDAGEMLAALVLIFAADHASEPLASMPHAIPMEGFWTSLAGSESWRKVQSRYADVQRVQDRLAHGTVFFNHFVRVAHVPTGKDLAAAYRRGAALFLPTNFPGMDIAIPIGMDDDGTDLAILLIQVKNRKADSPTDGLRRALAEDLQKATKKLAGADPGRPQPVVLGMAMCLRCEGGAQVDTTSPPPVRKSLKRKAKSSTPVAAETGHDEPLDMLGIVFGLAAYRCLSEITAADPQHEAMTQVRRLFEDLLVRWPDFYPARDTQPAYARRLLYPFQGDSEK